MADPVLEALWKRVTDAWDDDNVHGAFLRHCQETAQLGEAAARYSGMKGDRDRGKGAEKRLEAVALLATTSLLAEKTEPRKGVPRWLYVASVVFFGTLAAYAVARVFRG
jgi:hypothetical protein